MTMTMMMLMIMIMIMIIISHKAVAERPCGTNMRFIVMFATAVCVLFLNNNNNNNNIMGDKLPLNFGVKFQR